MNLRPLKRNWLLVFLAVAAVILVACGGSATATPSSTATPVPTVAPTGTPVPEPTAAVASTESSELTALETEYIEQVRAGWNEFNAKAMEFRSVFGQTYSQKSRLFQALLDAGAGTAFEAALAAVEQIDAPERFKADQDLMVQTLTELITYDHDVRSAAEDQDLAEFAISNARLAELSIFMATQLQESVCRSIEPEDFPFSLCNPNEQIPGGQYGAELNAVVDRFAAGMFARAVIFGLHYEAADIIAAEAVLMPEKAALISGLLDDLEKMQPTSGLADDHGKLVRYFQSLSEITMAKGEALDAQNIDAYRSVGAESRASYCDARADLSQNMMQIVDTFFSDPLGGCRFASTTRP